MDSLGIGNSMGPKGGLETLAGCQRGGMAALVLPEDAFLDRTIHVTGHPPKFFDSLHEFEAWLRENGATVPRNPRPNTTLVIKRQNAPRNLHHLLTSAEVMSFEEFMNDVRQLAIPLEDEELQIDDPEPPAIEL
ncbi:hypothetical protein SLS58_003108 [Diplodia intermedia]|uniref:Uncharacterized protein n=1 Tax=Diplodia intermedia TaxID=856260 RepID=A0ABR3TWW6_9PEZI